MFGVLLPLHPHPLYARGFFSAFLLRKVERSLNGNRESTEGAELSACAECLSVRPRAQPSPPEPNTSDRGEEWAVLGEHANKARRPLPC